jgi:hypothetical protein
LLRRHCAAPNAGLGGVGSEKLVFGLRDADSAIPADTVQELVSTTIFDEELNTFGFQSRQ